MKNKELQGNILDLTNQILTSSAAHVEARGLHFCNEKFVEAVGPLIEFISESAYLVASDALTEEKTET